MDQSQLITLLNNLETKGLLASKVNAKIQTVLDYDSRSASKLFLISTGLLAMSFLSAGIFSLIAHDWDDLPKHLKGFMSIIPSLTALYFYYLGLFKHKGSVVWAETTTLFLMLMIGASIALVSQTYNLDGDIRSFIKVWLVLSLPLFYLNKASGFSIVYLGLTLVFLQPEFSFFGGRFMVINHSIFFWIFFLAFLPHLFIHLDFKKSKQGFRAVFLGWLTVIVLFLAFVFAFRGGHLLWAPALLVGFYIFGKKYYSGNVSAAARPFQTSVLAAVFVTLIALTDRFVSHFIFKSDDLSNISSWSTEQYVYYFLGLIALVLVTIYVVKRKKDHPEWNRLIIYLPFLMVALILVHFLADIQMIDLTWIMGFVLNIYILILAIHALIQGSNSKNILYMFYGLFMAAILMWIRYFDMDYSFWYKAIFFIGVGGVFLLIMSIANDDMETD